MLEKHSVKSDIAFDRFFHVGFRQLALAFHAVLQQEPSASTIEGEYAYFGPAGSYQRSYLAGGELQKTLVGNHGFLHRRGCIRDV
jgi:hypothetical protein